MDKDMVLACVLARLQAEGKRVEQIKHDEMQKYIDEAIADLRLAEQIVNGLSA